MGIETRFPALTGRDLEGKEVIIPRDLPGEAQLLMVAFQRRHQLQVDSWSGVLADLVATYPGLGVWEIPTLSSGYRPFRAFIDGGMRAGIADPHTRRHTLTVYTSLRDVQRRLGLADFEDIRASTFSTVTAGSRGAGWAASTTPNPKGWRRRSRTCGETVSEDAVPCGSLANTGPPAQRCSPQVESAV